MARTVPAWVRKGKAAARGRQHGYRSGLEDTLGQQIAATGQPVQYESFRIPYVVPETTHHYTPDFSLANSIIVESKGIFDATDRAKHLFIKAQYPELDVRFVFTSSKAPIYQGSKTTLADWCRKYGFRFADKTIPPGWFTEPGPARHYADVIAAGPFAFAKQNKE